MTETLKGFVPIDPKPLKRHRTGRRGNYDPSRDGKRAFLEMCVIVVGRPENPPGGAVLLSVAFVCKIKRGRKPDIDNLVKFVMDALNGAYWKDDGQICRLIASRKFTPDPDKVGTHIEIVYKGD